MRKETKASFLVKVNYTEHQSMQGTLHWLEENKVVRFKSVMELISLLMEALPNEEMMTWDDVKKVVHIEEHLDQN
ncbi:MAG: hypothetical protein JXR88_09605 [Clostridia bacterium]|nr:hypothetical protein [Clostridia bacterium]